MSNINQQNGRKRDGERERVNKIHTLGSICNWNWKTATHYVRQTKGAKNDVPANGVYLQLHRHLAGRISVFFQQRERSQFDSTGCVYDILMHPTTTWAIHM